ncbi:TetR/AcrR family acrAB operon transcriptional repressor [Neisseria perflava]|uniref:multidrug efflux system transcriptional repressor MtrR n=1 Tax=Neisseria perflava TaxID=33053 RepID=UPI00209EE268|nr:TetR family transcriptional regulator [Neisseria perflava]MCP1772787.1 TetR/AcrR family acrAB operon transcriptional repressor [Neisseria perflava]
MRKTKTEAMKTKEHLMLAALDTFYKKGVSRTSLNEIAQAAGVTRGALYWHFKNKEDLFDSLFQRICKDVDECIQNDLTNNNGDHFSTFRQMLLQFFERIQSNDMHKKFYAVLFVKCEYTEQNEAIIALTDTYRAQWHENLGITLTNCISQKTLSEDLDTETTIIYLKTVINGLISEWLTAPEPFDLNKIAPCMIDMALDNLKNHALLRKAV